MEESLIFYSRYLHSTQTRFNQLRRNSEDAHGDSCKELLVFAEKGFPLSKDTLDILKKMNEDKLISMC